MISAEPPRTSPELWQNGHLKLHPGVKTVQATLSL